MHKPLGLDLRAHLLGICLGCRRTADPSAALRSGPTAGRGRRDDKGEGGASIDSRYPGWRERLNRRSVLSQLATASRLVPRRAGAGGMTILKAVACVDSSVAYNPAELSPIFITLGGLKRLRKKSVNSDQLGFFSTTKAGAPYLTALLRGDVGNFTTLSV